MLGRTFKSIGFRHFTQPAHKNINKQLYKVDHYKNIHINFSDLKQEIENISNDQEIVNYLNDLKPKIIQKENATALWLYLDLDHSKHLQPLIEGAGFEIHHSRYTDENKPIFVLSKWLDESTPSKLPHYSSHTCGVGGVIVHDDGTKILMIQERIKSVRMPNNWKFPGGLVDLGETLDQAAVREVFEETGIQSEFLGILGLREIHTNFRHGQGDLYFPCLMKLKDGAGDKIDMQETELSKCEWLSFKDLRDIQFYSIANQIMTDIILPNVSDEGKWIGHHYSDNPEDVFENLRYKSFGQKKAELFGRKQKFYSLYNGQQNDGTFIQ